MATVDTAEYSRINEPATTDLKVFVRVAELGTLSAVARERDVPVSQVSRAISRLEKDYQVRLINRSTHGLSLTQEGEMFLAHARHVVDSLTELAADLDSHAGSPVGVVRLSVSQIIGDAQIIPCLPALYEKYPELRIDVIADDGMVDLATEGIDLAVRTTIVANENLVAREVGEYGRALYASPQYLEQYGEPEHPDELLRHRCITHAASGRLNRWRFRFGRKQADSSIQGFYRVNNTAMSLTMVREGLGIARLNTSIAGPVADTGAIVPVLEEFRDPTRFPIYLVMLPDRHRLPKIKACSDHLARLFKRLKHY
jgi:DNA-binding transcriptional LysR family regulator